MAIEVGCVRVSGAALLALAAVCFFVEGPVLAAVAVSTAVHELGHVLAMGAFGCGVSRLRIDAWGLSMAGDRALPYRGEIAAAAAGPLASLLLALAAAAAGRAWGFEWAYITAGVSLLSCVFNGLPVMPLDGGMILYAALAGPFGPDVAGRVSCIVSCVFIFALLVAGAALLLVTGVNFSLLLAALWLLSGYCKKGGIGIKSKRQAARP